MPLEFTQASVAERVADLNARYRHHGAIAVLEHALADPQIGRSAMVSSFGAESVALLHMLSVVDRSVPVIFLDTEMLFADTLDYQAALGARLGLTDIRIVRPDRDSSFLRDPDAMLHRADPDACCNLRKREPLQAALAPFDAWITGRKRYQGAARAALEFFEADGTARLKVNPLAYWSREDVRDYIVNNRLPRHPLVARGFGSIGCEPCTSPLEPGENERAGRWRGLDKDECGIHLVDGRMQRAV